MTPGLRIRRPHLLSAAMLGVASGAILVPLNSTMLAVALPGVMGDFALGANEVSSLVDRKSTRLNSSHAIPSRMPSSA